MRDRSSRAFRFLSVSVHCSNSGPAVPTASGTTTASGNGSRPAGQLALDPRELLPGLEHVLDALQQARRADALAVRRVPAIELDVEPRCVPRTALR